MKILHNQRVWKWKNMKGFVICAPTFVSKLFSSEIRLFSASVHKKRQITNKITFARTSSARISFSICFYNFRWEEMRWRSRRSRRHCHHKPTEASFINPLQMYLYTHYAITSGILFAPTLLNQTNKSLLYPFIVCLSYYDKAM